MRAIIDLNTDTILSWGILYDEPEYINCTYEVPIDYSPETYEYKPKVSGVFDPDGFIKKDI